MKKTKKKVQPVRRGGVLDWIMLFANLWFVAGVYIDGWAHIHLEDRIETFFTPWHAALYSGFGVSALVVIVATLRNLIKKRSWRNAIPVGYELALVGVFIFGASGVGDLIWHEIFGIENNIEALLSPTHLGLVIGAVLMVSSPFRAAYRSADNSGPVGSWFPVIISVSLAYSVLTFITQYGSPLTHPWMFVTERPVTEYQEVGDFYGYSLGIEGIFLHVVLFMGFIFLLVRRWNMPFGTYTVILTLNAVGMALQRDYFFFIPVAILAGLMADLLNQTLDPNSSRGGLRIFSFLVPFIYYCLYFIALVMNGGTWYTTHLWTGTIFSAGAVGLMLSYVAFPPQRALEKT